MVIYQKGVLSIRYCEKESAVRGVFMINHDFVCQRGLARFFAALAMAAGVLEVAMALHLMTVRTIVMTMRTIVMTMRTFLMSEGSTMGLIADLAMAKAGCNGKG